jgi:putative nucleotidyltransferase with HDIG domain
MFANLKPRILIIDDEPLMRSSLTAALDGVAACVDTADCVEEGLNALHRQKYDIVLADMYLPGASGLELLAMSKSAHWDHALILITGRPELDQVISALRLGVYDFLIKPICVRDLTESIERNFHRLLSRRESHNYRRSLENSLQLRMHALQNALQSLESNYHCTLDSLVAALDAREHETCAHSFRVKAYTLHLARLIGYPPALLPQLEQAALLHDIGKIGISDTILLKNGRLTDTEFTTMREHAALGQQILSRITFLRPAANIVRSHHERFDGSGYPDRLIGDDIPLGARVFAFADTLDAMTSDRCYRSAPGYEAARAEIRRCAGTQFDPRIVAVFDQVKEVTWAQIREQVENDRSAMERDLQMVPLDRLQTTVSELQAPII